MIDKTINALALQREPSGNVTARNSNKITDKIIEQLIDERKHVDNHSQRHFNAESVCLKVCNASKAPKRLQQRPYPFWSR